MNNIYFKELFELAEDFNKFWHRKYYEVNIRGSRTYKNFNDYYQKHLESKKQEQEKYNDPNREVSEEKRKLIRDLITNEKSIKKEGLEFIVFTYKMKDIGILIPLKTFCQTTIKEEHTLFIIQALLLVMKKKLVIIMKVDLLKIHFVLSLKPNQNQIDSLKKLVN